MTPVTHHPNMPNHLSIIQNMGANSLPIMLLSVLFSIVVGLHGAHADDGSPSPANQATLVKQANAPISTILQVRFQDSWQPEFYNVHGAGNAFTLALTMPLPKYRLLPLPQMSLLSIPTVVTLPGEVTGFGDMRFLDIAVFHAGDSAIWGVGPTFIFPTASRPETGQGKWQVGPAAAVAFFPKQWLLGVLVQNPISFAGDHDRKDISVMIVQPFVSYQLGNGWFVRSQPQIIFNWKSGKQLVPLDLGVGRVFKIGKQDVNCFIEPNWNISHDGPAPKYGITFGVSLLYPNFWQ